MNISEKSEEYPVGTLRFKHNFAWHYAPPEIGQYYYNMSLEVAEEILDEKGWRPITEEERSGKVQKEETAA